MTVVNKGGRPRSFNSVNELESAIQYYFDSISKTDLLLESVLVGYEDVKKKKPIYDKVPILNNAGEQIEHTTYFENPSIIGMCLHMGIHRDTLCEYGKMIGYSDTIKAAKLRVEWFLENQLDRKDQVAGIIFNLKNNFDWHDKREIENIVEVRVPMLEEIQDTFKHMRNLNKAEVITIDVDFDDALAIADSDEDIEEE